MTTRGEVGMARQAATRASRRALVAGCVGNLVEWYDFALYGAFATVIAATFFPSGDPLGRLLASFAVFGVAFLARPAGALLFANWGDRRGRRRALAASVLLMGLITAGIGVLPGPDAIGWAAPVLLVVLRAGQGMAAGGEYGGSVALVVEYAPTDRRGRYGGWQWATIGLGLAAGISVAALCGAVLPEPIFQAWGWRLPFLLALPLALVGLYIRLRLDETPGFLAVLDRDAAALTPLRETLRSARRELVLGFALVAAVTVSFNIFYVFLPAHLATSGRAPLPRALAGAVAGLLAGAVAAPVAGRISDRVGRRPVLLAGMVALLLTTMPSFWLIHQGAVGGLVLGYAAMGVVLGVVALSAFLAELFPTRLRYSGLSLTFGLASAVFGGTAPALATVLVGRAGNPSGAAWYAGAVTAVAVACLLVAPETAHRTLDDLR
jgi:MHS family proline/betaine transporter-like MFS transporter